MKKIEASRLDLFFWQCVVLKGKGFIEGYGLQPVHSPQKNERALVPEGMHG